MSASGPLPGKVRAEGMTQQEIRKSPLEDISRRQNTGSGNIRVVDQRRATPMIYITHYMSCTRSGFINRAWLAVAISLFSCAASAEIYPVSGVWVAKDDQFPGSTAGACLLLKEFGVDAVLTQPFPRVMIFSGDKRFEMRGDFHAERTIRSVKGAADGSYQITESFRGRWLPFSKRPFFTLKIFNATTIAVTEGNISTRLSKCAPNSPSL
jgi:hypothetical protein